MAKLQTIPTAPPSLKAVHESHGKLCSYLPPAPAASQLHVFRWYLHPITICKPAARWDVPRRSPPPVLTEPTNFRAQMRSGVYITVWPLANYWFRVRSCKNDIAYNYHFMTLQHIDVRKIVNRLDMCLFRFSIHWLVLLDIIAKLIGAGLAGFDLRVRPQSLELQRPMRMVLWLFRHMSTAGTTALVFQERCECSKVQAYRSPRCTT